MLTRAKIGKSKPKPKPFLVHYEPNTTKQELAQPKWFQAMKIKYDSLIKNITWILTELPPYRKPIRYKWVFKVKENSDVSINKYKAQLVVKGLHHKHGFNFHETFLLVVKPITICNFLTLAIT